MDRRPIWLTIFMVSTIVGCNDGPFSYIPVKGKITYEDGEPIPAKSMRLTFVSQMQTEDPNIKPRPADVGVDVATGEFGCPISVRPGDGLVPGKHKVIVTPMDGRGGLSDVVPPEYAHATKTPLIVDTADSPFDLRVKQPEKPAKIQKPRRQSPLQRVK